MHTEAFYHTDAITIKGAIYRGKHYLSVYRSYLSTDLAIYHSEQILPLEQILDTCFCTQSVLTYRCFYYTDAIYAIDLAFYLSREAHYLSKKAIYIARYLAIIDYLSIYPEKLSIYHSIILNHSNILLRGSSYHSIYLEKLYLSLSNIIYHYLSLSNIIYHYQMV